MENWKILCISLTQQPHLTEENEFECIIHVLCKLDHDLIVFCFVLRFITSLEVFDFHRPSTLETWNIQCVPIKRKPVLSDLIKLYASLSRAFSLLSFDTKQMLISQGMIEKEQFKLMHVKMDLRRIIVLS